MKLDILLRVCNKHENNPDMKRIIKVSRDELILRCLKSLITSINYYNKDIFLTIINDSTIEFRDQIFSLLSNCRCPFNYLDVEMNNNESMKYCYNYAKCKFDDVVFFVEDDYLFFPHCIKEMVESYELFKHNLGGKEVAIHPADSPLEYFPDALYQSRIVLGYNRHWRTSVSSPFSLMISKTSLVKHYQKFMDYSKFDGVNYHEANTINLMFIDDVHLFTPIPTLAFHLGYIDPPAPFCDHTNLWKNNKIQKFF